MQLSERSVEGPCRIYLCSKRRIDKTGYCEDHVSDLRPGLDPLTPGSAPVRVTSLAAKIQPTAPVRAGHPWNRPYKSWVKK